MPVNYFLEIKQMFEKLFCKATICHTSMCRGSNCFAGLNFGPCKAGTGPRMCCKQCDCFAESFYEYPSSFYICQ